MHAKEAILQTISLSDMIIDKYLGDLDDEALFVMPVEGMNHVAWQLGHLISSERGMVEGIKPGSCPPLPEGFDTAHAKDQGTGTDRSKFHTKAQYLDAWKTQRAATRALLETMSDADLDAPAPEKLLRMCPNVGQVFNLTGLHAMMHVGQFVAVRREQKRPVAF